MESLPEINTEKDLIEAKNSLKKKLEIVERDLGNNLKELKTQIKRITPFVLGSTVLLVVSGIILSKYLRKTKKVITKNSS